MVPFSERSIVWSQLIMHTYDAVRMQLGSEMPGASMFMEYFTTLDNASGPSKEDV